MSDDLTQDRPALPPPTEKSEAYLKTHPYTDVGEESNTKIGVDGNSPLPGSAGTAHLKKGTKKRFKGFPKLKRADGSKNPGNYDMTQIKADYMASPITEWAAYCASRGYNPYINSIGWKPWVREKKYKLAWNSVRDELEAEGTRLGANTLLKQVRAVRQIPETANGMLTLVQHTIQLHMMEAKADQAYLKQCSDAGVAPDFKKTQFTLDAQGAVFLASALKQTGEMLYKSLGIESSLGVSAAKWIELANQELDRIDGVGGVEQSKELVKVEVVGVSDMKEAMLAAMQKYLDRPQAPDPLPVVPPPDGLAPGDPVEDGESSDQESEFEPG